MNQINLHDFGPNHSDILRTSYHVREGAVAIVNAPNYLKDNNIRTHFFGPWVQPVHHFSGIGGINHVRWCLCYI